MLELPGYRVVEQMGSNEEIGLYRVLRVEDNVSMIVKTTSDHYAGSGKTASFQAEYEQLLRLRGEGILEPYRMEIINNRPVLLLHDPGGTTLYQLMQSHRISLSLADLLRTAIAIVDCVRLIQHHITLNEVIPLYFMVSEDLTEVRLLDIRSCSVDGHLTHSTKPILLEDRPLSILPYLCPERTRRTGLLSDYRADFYSIGVILYEWFTKSLPFASDNALDLMHLHLTAVPEPVHMRNKTIPRVVSDIVSKCMEKMPEARYASAYGIKSDLEECSIQLRVSGKVESFPIASHDISERWFMSEGLLGRRDEQQVLLQALHRACEGSVEAVWVSGDAGMGKTALVTETLRKAIPVGAFLVTGKFNFTTATQPYILWANIMDDLVSYFLASNQLQVEVWRQRILYAVQDSGRLLTDMVPRLQLLIGEQPILEELPPREAEIRLYDVLDRFFQLFFGHEQPLILFLDDLQWTDEASLYYLRHMLELEDAQYVLVIGAYREHHWPPAHPLRRLMLQFSNFNAISMAHIYLAAYDRKALRHMLSPIIHDTADGVDELIGILLHKTGGNPLYLKQFLQEIRNQKLILFDEQQRVWHWDAGQIARRSVSDQVADSLLNAFQDLSDSCMQIAARAAIVGPSFNQEILSAILELETDPLSALLQEAVDARILQPVPGERQVYFFQHDRLRQSLYECVSEQERMKLHTAIGWLLADRMNSGGSTDLFEATHHLNQVTGHVIFPHKDKERLAELNVLASLQAKQSGAYETAREYIRRATDLLEEDSWNTCYALCYQAYKERGEIEFLCDDLTEAGHLLKMLFDRSASDQEKAQLCVLMVQLEMNQYQYEQVIVWGQRGLKLLGISYRLFSRPLERIIRWIRVKHKLPKQPALWASQLPLMADERYKSAMSILVYMSNASFNLNHSQWSPAILLMLELTIDHGMTAEASIGFAGYALLLHYQFQQYEQAYLWGSLACEVSRADPKLYAHACNTFLLCNQSWSRYEPRLLYTFIEQLNKEAIQSLDQWQANQSLLLRYAYLFQSGYPVNEIYVKLQSHFDSFLPQYNSFHWKQAAILSKMMSSITGYRTIDDPFKDTDIDAPGFMEVIHEEEVQILQGYVDFYHYITGYLLGDYARAHQALESSRKLLGKSSVDAPTYYYYRVLVTKELYAVANKQEKARYQAEIRISANKLKAIARHDPERNRHKYLLAKAELARLRKRYRQAERWYEEALITARAQGYMHDEGIIAECFAQYGIQNSKAMIAKLHMNEAYETYMKWGAIAKTKELLMKYGYLLQAQQDTGSNAARMDYLSVAMTAQALSGEMDMDRLLHMLMRIMLQNAGAEYGALILHHENQWIVEAYGTVDRLYMESIVLEEAEHLVPVPLIGYTARTKEEIVLHDAASISMYERMEYNQDKELRSVLCLPIKHQNKLIALLYMENNLSAGIFTKERIDVLKLLSPQCAISIVNAKLYSGIQYLKDSLEDQVSERTRSLEVSMKVTSEAIAETTVYAERTRIAQEIHDIVGHTLTSTIVQIEAGKRLLSKDMDSALLRLKEAQDLVRHSLNEIRNSVHMLKEDKYYDIECALYQLIQDTERNADVIVHALIDPIEYLTLIQKKVIYHALQEGLTNGLKHGNCNEFSLSIRDEEGLLQFRLADNGAGFNQIEMGFGLKMMRERVRQLKGTLSIESEPGRGCLLRIILPYDGTNSGRDSA